jgi:hypothetical protein
MEAKIKMGGGTGSGYGVGVEGDFGGDKSSPMARLLKIEIDSGIMGREELEMRVGRDEEIHCGLSPYCVNAYAPCCSKNEDSCDVENMYKDRREIQ